MASPIQELFHLVTGKNSLSSRESLKASSIRTAIAANFPKAGRLASGSWVKPVG